MADERKPTFGSLFAGIGGIDLGLERAGWECRFQVEWDDYCQRVLAKHWPDVPRYGDITAVDWAGVERVDLLAGGFPCQPFSFAGKQQRMADDRWLWPEFARAIRDLRPRYVLVENVPGLLVGGGMDLVLGELAELGYDAEWESIPAAAVGAPHLRYRVWIIAVAHAERLRPGRLPDLATGYDGHRDDARWSEAASGAARGGTAVALADPDDRRCGQRDAGEWRLPIADPSRDVPDAAPHGRGSGRTGRPDPSGPRQPEQPLPDVAHALGQRGRGGDARWEDAADVDAPGEGVGPGWDGGWWTTEPDVGRVAHGVPARVDRLRALANAVVPQVVEVIGRRLLEAMIPVRP